MLVGTLSEIREVNFRRRRYDQDAFNLFGRFSVQPDTARKRLISDRFTAGKAYAFWAKLDALWVHGAHGPEAARLNWLNSRFDCLPVNAPTFTTDQGYSGDGATSYLNTQYNPATATSIKATQNSTVLGIRSNTDSASAGGSVAGFYDGTGGTTINPRSSFFGDNVTNCRANQNTAMSGVAGDSMTSRGMYIVTRTGALAAKTYRNGVVMATDTTNSSRSPANGSIRLGSIADNSYRALQFSMGFVGSGFTDQDAIDIYNWFEPYRVALGIV